MGCPCMASTAPNCTQHPHLCLNKPGLQGTHAQDQLFWQKLHYCVNDIQNFVTVVCHLQRERERERERAQTSTVKKSSNDTHDRLDEEAVGSGKVSEPQSSTFLEGRYLLCHVSNLELHKIQVRPGPNSSGRVQLQKKFKKPTPSRILCYHTWLSNITKTQASE